MFKRNHSGFAITTLIYGLSLMGISIVLLLMAIMSIHRNNTADLVREVEKELTHMIAVSGVMASSEVSADSNVVFGNEIPNIDRDSFEKIITVNYKAVPENAINFFDASATKNGSVMAWYLDENGNGLYELYIGQKGGVVAPEDCQYLFAGFTNLKYLDLAYFSTYDTTRMSYMFSDAGANSTEFSLVLREQFDTSKVTNMDVMFSRCGYLANHFVLDLRTANFDTSKVVTMYSMFQSAGWGIPVSTDGSFELYLGDKFDTSNVSGDGMNTIFSGCGGNQKTFVLDLGNKFDTSNITNMENMFSETANRSENVTLSLGDKFDTSNATNMYRMFYQLAKNDSNFELDLSTFDFSKVESYELMFDDMNPNTKIYVQSDAQRNWIINNPGFAGDRILIK